MLWREIKDRVKSLRGPSRTPPSLAELLSVWVEEAPELDGPLRAKDMERDTLALKIMEVPYDSKSDGLVSDAIRTLPAPVSAQAVVSLLLEKHEAHPVVRCLVESFGCKKAEDLSPLLNLKAMASVAVSQTVETPMLKSMTTDLTEKAKLGAFAGLVAGPATDALERVLLKARRGSVILTSPQGAGKTAAVQALAHRIVNNQCHPKLRHVQILELNGVGSLVAGTQFRGQFSERIEGLLTELKAARGKVILFCDETHTVIGAGRVHNDSYDLANALKTALSNNEIRFIGATTDVEYTKYILKDPAFARRLERVRIQPLSGSALDSVVLSQVSFLAERHNVVLEESVWREAMRLSDLYLANRAAQPDRVLDLLDTSCTSVPQNGNLERHHLLSALAQMTGVPSDILDCGLLTRLDQARDQLVHEVVGQDGVISAILSRLQSNPLHRRAAERPLGSFLLTGPSGVGKGLIAETLCCALFGSQEALLRINCGEYSEGGIAKLIGFPLPGLDGQDTNGALGKFLSHKPTGVVLFDEIEKAHPTFYEVLLGILDKGEFQGGDGTSWSLRSHIVCCTSNALTTRNLYGESIGFGESEPHRPSRERLIEKLTMFRKELCNRFDDILVVEPLSSSSRLTMLKRHSEVAFAAARAAGVPTPSDAELIALLLLHQEAIDQAGGRAIERLVDDEIVPPLQRALRVRSACTSQQPIAEKKTVKPAGVANKVLINVL